MKLSSELLKKAKQCKSAEEIKSFAKENGAEMTDAEAVGAFVYLNKNGELSDDELNNVAGGTDSVRCSGDKPRYQVGYATRYLRPYTWGDYGVFGTILKVSDTKKGTIFKEFVYTMMGTDGQQDEVYEAAIDYYHQ